MKKSVLINFTEFTGKHLYQSLFLTKSQACEGCNFIKKETLAQVLSCEFCEMSTSTLFQNTSATASDFICSLFFIFSIIKIFATRKVASCKEIRLVENRLKKGVFRNLAKFTGKHCCQSLCQSLRLWHMFFPVNFARSLLTPFFTELRWLLLNFKRDLSTRTCQTDFQPKTIDLSC